MTTQVPRAGLSDGVRREHPTFHLPGTTGTYVLWLNAPTDGTVKNIYFQVDAVTSVDFRLQVVDGGTTNVNWTTGSGGDATLLKATTTAAEDIAASNNTFSAGAAIQVVITAVSGTPAVLSGQLVIDVPEEDSP